MRYEEAKAAPADEVAGYPEGLHDYSTITEADRPWLIRAAQLLRDSFSPNGREKHD